MRNYSLLLIFIVLSIFRAYPSSNSNKLIFEGNEAYHNANYTEAINKYTEALNLDPTSEIAQFNIATALVVLGTETNDSAKVNLAEQKFKNLVRSNSKSISKKSNFDLGNIAYNKQDYKNSIDYYKKVLRTDPSDDLARKYLRMAQLKLQSQQNQEQKNDNKEEKEQEKNNENQQDNKEQQDKADKQEQQQNHNQSKQEEQQQPNTNNINSENLLKSIEDKEQQTLMRINARKNEAIRREHEASRANIDKPW